MSISVKTLINQARNFHTGGALEKSFKAKYRAFWTPKVTEPPYQHAVQVGDPVLRRKCDAVPAEGIGSGEIKFLVKLMTNVMDKYKCVGLAAPQIGIPLRVIALEFKEAYKKDFAPEVVRTRNMQELPLTVLINPVLKVTDYEKKTFTETCASVTGYSAEVPRYNAVELTGLTAEGEERKLVLSGWNARIAQHEMDHIDGVIFTDLMDRKTLACTCWDAVNTHNGRVEMRFDGKS